VIGDKLSAFNNLLVGSERVDKMNIDETGLAVCNEDGLNFMRQRYLSSPDDFNLDAAYQQTYRSNHYRCRLPIYTARSYKTRINTIYGDVQKEASASAKDANGTSYEFQYYADIHRVVPKVVGVGGGTEVLIQGVGFSYVAAENSVTLAGRPCKVTAATTTSLTCASSPVVDGEGEGNFLSESGEKLYLGGRGMSRVTVAAPGNMSALDEEGEDERAPVESEPRGRLD
jgi:hypothetical protein